jgi:hypothetical protein
LHPGKVVGVEKLDRRDALGAEHSPWTNLVQMRSKGRIPAWYRVQEYPIEVKLSNQFDERILHRLRLRSGLPIPRQNRDQAAHAPLVATLDNVAESWQAPDAVPPEIELVSIIQPNAGIPIPEEHSVNTPVIALSPVENRVNVVFASVSRRELLVPGHEHEETEN